MMFDQRINELNEAIERSRQATATLWEYSASLSQLSIRVTWSGKSENLHFVCNACTRIESVAAWTGVDFEVQHHEEGRFTLVDQRAKFFVECGLIRVLHNVEPIFNVQ
jgi:hypothetical protein